MNTVKFIEMRWSNLFSYAENNSIKFDENRLSQIIGMNGAGKSSIPIILEEALYNKNSKGFKKAEIPNRLLNKPYSVEVDFEKEGSSYTVSVKKAATLKVTLTKDGEDISAHTATNTFNLVEELLGFSFKTFTQLIYQSTRSSLQFLTATDAKRKEFLIELFDMAVYTEKYEKFNSALKSIVQEITKLEGSIEATSKSIQKFEKLATGEEISLKEVPEVDDSLLQEKAELQVKLEHIQKENKYITEGNKVLNQLAKMRELDEIQKDIDSLEIEDKTPLVESLGRRNSNISIAKTTIEKIEKLSSKCPTCLQDIDADFVAQLLSENKSIIDSNRAEAKEIVETVKKIEDAEKELSRLRIEYTQRTNVEAKKRFEEYTQTLDYEELDDRLNAIGQEIDSISKRARAAKAHNDTAVLNNANITSAGVQLQELQTEIVELQEKYEVLNKKRKPLEVLKKAFGPSGLIPYKLENMVLDLEDATNKYLARLSDGQFNLTFELQNDKLNVVILNNGSEVSMTTLSSGQEARVIISTLLGIRKIMQSISKQTVNILFLDEVISVLDDTGKEQLVEVLLDEPGLNTFLVSHGWQHPLVPKLEVVQTEGISKILW